MSFDANAAFQVANDLKHPVLRTIGVVMFVTLVSFPADYAWLTYRISRHRVPFSTITVQPYYAIHQKNGRTEYDFAPPESQPCVHSLFPHLGYTPCWYLKRHTEKRISTFER